MSLENEKGSKDSRTVVETQARQQGCAAAFALRVAIVTCGSVPAVALGQSEGSARVLRELTSPPLFLAQAELGAQVQTEVPPLPTADTAIAAAAPAAAAADAGLGAMQASPAAAEAQPSAQVPAVAEAPVVAQTLPLAQASAVAQTSPLAQIPPLNSSTTTTSSSDLAPAQAAPQASAPADASSAQGAQDPLAELRVGPAAGPNDLWKGLSVAVVFLGALAGGGVMLVKGRKRGLFQSPERHMEVLSSLSLSPKRQILLVRIRDQEFAVSSTEQGISFLSEVGQRLPATKLAAAAPEARLQAARSTTRPFLERGTGHAQEDVSLALEGNVGNDADEAGDLRSLTQRIRNFAQGERKARETVAAPARTEPKLRTNPAPTPTTAAARSFPKYLAKSFEAEGQRVPQARPAAAGMSSRADAESESVENVTNMIRAKLKEMKA